MYCINGDGKPIENRDTGECASCGAARRKAERMRASEIGKPISKVSAKMGANLSKYAAKKAKWIRGKKCAVHPELPAEDIHHMVGRVGYADEWARENDVPLLIDERFWLPVSRIAHQRITDNPKWANENGYSYLRITDPIFRKQ